MLTESLIRLFNRDLNKLIEEINLYKDESNLWRIDGLVANSSGNLCLHLIGNLNHFIGSILGDTVYIRQRNLEFSSKNISRIEMIEQINQTSVMVEKTLLKLTQEDLDKEYRRNLFEDFMTTEYFLMHLAMHLSYHLGQINYHRRLLDV